MFTVILLSVLYVYKNRTFLHLHVFSVNSEANARRIAFVEQCFGSSGQVKHAFPIMLLSCLVFL